MSTILLYHAVAVAVLCLFCFIGMRWAGHRGRSPEVGRLRKIGEDLLARNRAIPVGEAIATVEHLFATKAIETVRTVSDESVPDLICELPLWPRGIFEQYKTIYLPESSLELGWHMLDRPNQQMLCIGRAHYTGNAVLLDIGTGMVTIGRDVFPSLAHMLLFEAGPDLVDTSSNTGRSNS